MFRSSQPPAYPFHRIIEPRSIQVATPTAEYWLASSHNCLWFKVVCDDSPGGHVSTWLFQKSRDFSGATAYKPKLNLHKKKRGWVGRESFQAGIASYILIYNMYIIVSEIDSPWFAPWGKVEKRRRGKKTRSKVLLLFMITNYMGVSQNEGPPKSHWKVCFW